MKTVCSFGLELPLEVKYSKPFPNFYRNVIFVKTHGNYVQSISLLDFSSTD